MEIPTYFMAFVNAVGLLTATIIENTNMTIALLFIVLIILLMLLAVGSVAYFIYECTILMYLRLRGYYLKRKYLNSFKEKE